MAVSRRMSRRGKTAERPQSAPRPENDSDLPVQGEIALDDIQLPPPSRPQLSIDDEESPSSASAAPTGPSPSQRGRAVSSRRLSSTSGRSNSERLSVEEQAAQKAKSKAEMKMAIVILGSIGVLLLLGVVIFTVAGRADKPRLIAKGHLDEVLTSISAVRNKIDHDQLDEAEKLIAQVIQEHLEIPAFARAERPDPAPNAPGMVDRELAIEAYKLRLQLNELGLLIPPKREMVLVTSRANKLENDIRSIASLDDAGLVDLLKRVDAFLDNPVAPGSGKDPSAQERYKNLIEAIKANRGDITMRQQDKDMNETTTVIYQTQVEVGALTKIPDFTKALKYLDDQITQKPKAQEKLKELRADVVLSGNKHWANRKAEATNHYTNYLNPATPQSTGVRSLENAQAVLNLGITELGTASEFSAAVEEAQKLKETYKAKTP